MQEALSAVVPDESSRRRLRYGRCLWPLLHGWSRTVAQRIVWNLACMLHLAWSIISACDSGARLRADSDSATDSSPVCLSRGQHLAPSKRMDAPLFG